MYYKQFIFYILFDNLDFRFFPILFFHFTQFSRNHKSNILFNYLIVFFVIIFSTTDIFVSKFFIVIFLL